MGCCSSTVFSTIQRQVSRAGTGRLHRLQSQLRDSYKRRGVVLGTGVSGTVYQGEDRAGRKVAMKSLRVGICEIMTDKKAAKHAVREVDILLSVHHPHIVRLLDVYEEPSSFTLITELLEGGTLQSYLRHAGRLGEGEAAATACQMFSAVAYLHSNLIIHRDLKPDNFVFSGPDSHNGVLKLIDFGFSKRCTPGKLMKTCKGTLSYIAPEVLKHQYTQVSDIWSMGVIMFRCLTGSLPFQDGLNVHPLLAHKFEDEVRSRIVEGHVIFRHMESWRMLTSEARHFVKNLLSRDPAERPSADEVLLHRWLRSNILESKSA